MNRARIVCFLTLPLFLLSLATHALGQQPEIADQLDAQIAKLPASVRIGVFVQSVADGAVWYDHDGDALLKPASTMKLFVTAAALQYLGRDFSFKTDLYSHDGELWVRGAGDPGIGDYRLAAKSGERVNSVFDRWSAALRAAGIDKISKIVLDDSVFDTQYRHEDWPIDQAHRWYEAPVGALNFNDNCLDTRAVIRDGQVTLLLTPDLPPVFYDNQIRRGPKHHPMISRSSDSDVFKMSGTITRDDDLGPISAYQPSVFFGHALKQALEKRGIPVSGDVVRRQLDPQAIASAIPIASLQTPLRDVVWRANNFSQNLFAECLIKSLAAYQPDGARGPTPGSWADGARILRATVETMGVEMQSAVLRDGSGLSHKNRVTPRQMCRLLRVMRTHPAADIFIDSLAEPGEDSTLRRRFKDPALRDKIQAKTGTLQGVSALAGYIQAPGADTLTFAILINGAGDNAHAIEDAIVSILAGQTPKRPQKSPRP